MLLKKIDEKYEISSPSSVKEHRLVNCLILPSRGLCIMLSMKSGKVSTMKLPTISSKQIATYLLCKGIQDTTLSAMVHIENSAKDFLIDKN